jgi:hypothetical protein
VKVKKEKTKYIRTVVVPNTRRVGHVDVVVFSKCSNVWMDVGKKGCLRPGKGLNRV